MNDGQQLFALFYAILYGVFTTVTHRWRPFQFGYREGTRRALLSLFFLAACPFFYFVVVMVFLQRHPITVPDTFFSADFVKFLLLFFFLGPMGAFYTFWGYILNRWKKKFYSAEEWKILGVGVEEQHRHSSAWLFVGLFLLLASVLVLGLWFLF